MEVKGNAHKMTRTVPGGWLLLLLLLSQCTYTNEDPQGKS